LNKTQGRMLRMLRGDYFELGDSRWLWYGLGVSYLLIIGSTMTAACLQLSTIRSAVAGASWSIPQYVYSFPLFPT